MELYGGFTILTQLALIFLSMSRLMVVIHPIDTKFKISSFVYRTIALAYALSFAMALLVILSFKFIYKKLPISLC